MWTGIIAAGGAIAGGLIGANASKKAASAQSDASNRATAENTRQFNLSRDDLSPYRTAGGAALDKLSTGMGLNRVPSVAKSGFIPREQFDADAYLAANPDVAKAGVDPYAHYLAFGKEDNRQGFQLGEMAQDGTGSLTRKFTMEDMQNDPVMKSSFDFGLSEGEKAVKRMFGARGLSRSGAAVKAASRFATDYTGTKAGESRARFVEDQNNEFNKLSGISGTGQAATTTTAGLGANTAGTNAGILTAEGNARGAAAIARGNAASGAINTIGNNVMGQYTLDRILSSNERAAQTRQFSMDAPLIQPQVSGQFNLDTYG